MTRCWIGNMNKTPRQRLQLFLGNWRSRYNSEAGRHLEINMGFRRHLEPVEWIEKTSDSEFRIPNSEGFPKVQLKFRLQIQQLLN